MPKSSSHIVQKSIELRFAGEADKEPANACWLLFYFFNSQECEKYSLIVTILSQKVVEVRTTKEILCVCCVQNTKTCTRCFIVTCHTSKYRNCCNYTKQHWQDLSRKTLQKFCLITRTNTIYPMCGKNSILFSFNHINVELQYKRKMQAWSRLCRKCNDQWQYNTNPWRPNDIIDHWCCVKKVRYWQYALICTFLANSWLCNSCKMWRAFDSWTPLE